MSILYLIRHGQAGTRTDYDTLSELGRAQARRAGEHLADEGVVFRAASAGALRRQRETAAEFARAYRSRGLPFPEIACDPGWNEFDLETVYREMAPALAAEDARFREEYAALERLAADDGDPVHRRWSACDTAIVRAWIEGRHRSTAESWPGFIARVEGRLGALPRWGEGEAVAVFTSAVPIAIWVAMSLGVTNGHIMQIAAVMYNSAITSFQFREGRPALFSFNGVPHLPEREMRSFR